MTWFTAKTSSPGSGKRAIAPMCAHLLNEFARASGRWTRISHTLRTMLVSATAGYLRHKLGFVWRLRSLRAKTSLLAFIFALVPVFLYVQFQKAYQDSQDLLLQSVRDQGRVISQSLLPLLENAAISDLPQLGQPLERFAGKVTTIKLLLAPKGADGDGFYYVASWPAAAGNNLDAERQLLAGQGVLDRLAQSCRGEMPFSLLYDRPTGGAEIVTAVTPLLTPAGCWAVVASFSAEAFPGAHLGQPYWATPTVQIAAAIYLAMVIITFTTLLGIGGGLRRFALLARQIREQGRTTGGFAARNEIPELAEVAAEFDRMVEALHGSAARRGHRRSRRRAAAAGRSAAAPRQADREPRGAVAGPRSPLARRAVARRLCARQRSHHRNGHRKPDRQCRLLRAGRQRDPGADAPGARHRAYRGLRRRPGCAAGPARSDLRALFLGPPKRRAEPLGAGKLWHRAVDRAAQCRGDARNRRGAEPHPAWAHHSHPAAARAIAGRAALRLSRIIVFTRPRGPALSRPSACSGGLPQRLKGGARIKSGHGVCDKGLATSIGGGEFVG